MMVVALRISCPWVWVAWGFADSSSSRLGSIQILYTTQEMKYQLFSHNSSLNINHCCHVFIHSYIHTYIHTFTRSLGTTALLTTHSGEEFMELFCIFPFVGYLMMRNGEFDEKGHVHTTGLPGTMIVSMVFSDDTNKDGDIDWFNKRERFRNMTFGWTGWDMVSNFGFRTLDDGTIECYHYGEYFHGNLPIISQIALLAFKIHARWLAWSTEHHINHYAFTANTEEEEEMEEESRKNMPFFLLKNYAWSDLMAMVFGTKQEEVKDGELIDKSSFLVRRKGSMTNNINNNNDSLDTDDSTNMISSSNRLPFQEAATKIQIRHDIASDRVAVQSVLARTNTTQFSTDEAQKALLTRTYSSVKEPAFVGGGGEGGRGGDVDPKQQSDNGRTTTTTVFPKRRYSHAYGVATEAARLRHLTRRATLVGNNSTFITTGDTKVAAKKDD